MRSNSITKTTFCVNNCASRPGFGGLIGVSPKMQRVYKMVQKVSQHNYPVLILGESGTGKELVARSIHFSGIRQQKPFVPVDCSGLVPTLIESELFGYVKGAFTGAQHPVRACSEPRERGHRVPGRNRRSARGLAGQAVARAPRARDPARGRHRKSAASICG